MDSFLFVCFQHAFDKKTHTTHGLQLFLTGKGKLHEKKCQLRYLGSFFFGRLGWVDKNQLLKKTRKEP